jgi:hypothetical protein
LQPVLLCPVAKKSPGLAAAPTQPVGELVATSAALEHTWNPGAQRSAALHPAPSGLLPEFPAA